MTTEARAAEIVRELDTIAAETLHARDYAASGPDHTHRPDRTAEQSAYDDLVEAARNRERARSAVLSVLMLDRAAAIEHARTLSYTRGPHLVAESDVDTIRYNDPTAPRYIARAGDWDSRSAWQPYGAPGAVII